MSVNSSQVPYKQSIKVTYIEVDHEDQFHLAVKKKIQKMSQYQKKRRSQRSSPKTTIDLLFGATDSEKEESSFKQSQISSPTAPRDNQSNPFRDTNSLYEC